MLTNPRRDFFWTKCLEVLMSKIPETAFFTWFTNLELIESEHNAVTIGTPNNFVLDYVSHHYKDTIRQAIEEIMESSVDVSFVNLDKSCNSQYTGTPLFEENDHGVLQDSFTSPALIDKTVLDSTLALNPTYSFDNFVVGDCNQLAHAACTAVAEAPQNNNFNPLVIYGGTGLGKTHLLQAVAHFVKDAETARKVVYRTSEEFTREYIDFVAKKKDSASFYRVYQDTDVLLIDDIQFLAGKKSTQEQFYSIFNNLQQLNKQVIITSDRLPSEIKGLHTRLLSRFDTGLLANLQPPKLEMRLAILRKKQESDNKGFISDEVLSYVANSVASNVRELEGTLIKLSAYACFTQIPVTVEIAKRILGDTIRNENKPITIKKIIRDVSLEFNVPVSHLTSQSRKRNVAEPRQIAMYLARKLTDNSLPTIGLAFGRDYSTVIHSLKKMETVMKTNIEIRDRTDSLKEKILGGFQE
ncbi:MAG: chromosomal replication initiator protein DnaA [Fibrobacteria bacterium]|nr:chromosomal replication initiator protein DnaA [Fibrobacteria bacterium]